MENDGRRSAEEYSVGLESLGVRMGKSAYCSDIVTVDAKTIILTGVPIEGGGRMGLQVAV